MSTDGERREEVWGALMRAHAAAYPLPVHGHHPNFRGASEAAERLAGALFADALLRPGDTVLSFPDYVLKPLRKRLLEAGVDVVVPAKYGHGYRRLASGRVDPAAAASIAGAERHGDAVTTLPEVRLVAVACVALTASGDYLGKGYGFALPTEVAALPRVALAHPLQRVASIAAPDGRLRLYAGPAEVSNPSAPSRGGELD